MKPRDLWPALLFIARCVFHLSAEPLANNTQPFECYVDDPLACNQSKYEVCIFRSGAYSCQCPQNVTRSADGRCIVIDECAEERLNDCHQNAICIDKVRLLFFLFLIKEKFNNLSK
ncbi:unnamed protein product [Brugia pahangi]|uniref:TIL domain-containing protein n=1 Tax=Brugia pahangi TaxID=6280 RepID=A0A0N4T8J2_BRUPA|nr:unnamed protein product [Brugia pahangi]